MPEPPKICIVGAGFSGIAAGIKLKTELGITSYTIFDENEDVGGTWLCNTYPGCACDVPSHLYSFSFEPNPNWSSAYSSQGEIWEYLKRVSRKYGLYDNTKFKHQVVKLEWNDKIQKWNVTVRDNSSQGQKEHQLTFDIVISGIGGLRVPHTPEEFLNFKGARMHSAQWDSSISLENKVVGIVGSGASAVQIIPTIVKKVKKLVVYQRHPTWVVPRLQFKFPEVVKKAFELVPQLRKIYRAAIFWTNEINFPSFYANSFANKLGEKLGRYYLNKQVGSNPELLKKLTPNYAFGCKRITPSTEYYPALSDPRVDVVISKIKEVKSGSIVTEDGQESKLDVLICATGFKVQDFFAPMEIRGMGGVDVLEKWKAEGPSALLGMCSYGGPNVFFLLGPNSGLGHSSVIFVLECQIDWTIGVIREMMRRECTFVESKEWAEKQFMSEMLQSLDKTVWAASDCGSWYADKRGVITALMPYSLVAYWSKTRKPDFNLLNFL